MGPVGKRMRSEFEVCREQYLVWGHIAAKTLCALLAVNTIPALLLYLNTG